MGKLMNILPVSDLRQDAAKVLKQLRVNKDPLIITQRGRAAAVIIGVEAYEKSEHDKELLHIFGEINHQRQPVFEIESKEFYEGLRTYLNPVEAYQSSAIVLSPFRASSATLALKAAS